MLGMSFSGLTEAVLLIALGLGYIVCYLAKREEGTFKTTGYLVGLVIIILSGVLVLHNLLLSAKICSKMGGMMPPPPHRSMMR